MTEDEMVGWHHRLDGRESEQAPGDGDGQGGLARRSPATAAAKSLCATPWTIACLAPLPMEFSRQEYWSVVPFPTPGDLPDSGIELKSPARLPN